jgi:hypothetical protein
LRAQHLCYGMVKFERKEGFSPFKLRNSSPSPSLLFQALVHPLPYHGSLQCFVHCCAARNIPSLKEAPPAKVMLCALVASTELEKTLDAAKEVTKGAGVPSAKINSWSLCVVATRGPFE